MCEVMVMLSSTISVLKHLQCVNTGLESGDTPGVNTSTLRKVAGTEQMMWRHRIPETRFAKV